VRDEATRPGHRTPEPARAAPHHPLSKEPLTVAIGPALEGLAFLIFGATVFPYKTEAAAAVLGLSWARRPPRRERSRWPMSQPSLSTAVTTAVLILGHRRMKTEDTADG
jgi:hypothetical protein